MKYACIARHHGEFPVRLMCECLDVSPSGFYAAQHRPLSARGRSTQRLRLEIRAVHARNHRRYGAPKVHRELVAQGIPCGHNRVARLMRADGLRAKRSRVFRVTTQSDHAYPTAANHLARRFAVTDWQRDRAWVADLTYLETQEGWLYLAVLLDLSSRRIVGWNADRRLEQSLTGRALEMALRQRRPAAGLLHHSDRGVQYVAGDYQRLLATHGAIASMSRVGDCWDNAVAESFFATLKGDLADADWPTRHAAHRDVFTYITWYNQYRRHESLDYLSPNEFEAQRLIRGHAA